MTRRAARFVLFAILLSAPLFSAESFPSLFTGTISDSECGLDHTRMKGQHHLPNDAVCTRECCEKYRQEYVLADHAGGDVYQLDDQKAARRWANRVVRVLGTLDAESGTIRVVRIEPAR
ncbi:MAG TPA: DUF5818 domain-containing protein [Thermoanaerobaculia bacterium]|nr:DUF5818 domain-containing protein [Thermoanaerobaculia bacterium]